MKKRNTTTRFKLNPAKPPKADWKKFDAMSDSEKHRAAMSDPDCQPAKKSALARAKRAPNMKSLRRTLNFTQEEFAERFHLSLGAIRDWEQGKHAPDRAAQAFLKVIAFNPTVVLHALEARP